MLARVLPIAVVAAVLGALGCEKADHENIDKWAHTRKGPAKLLQAVTDDGLDPDLSAHAAANLIRADDDREVYAAFEAMSPARRAAVIARLAPRMWDTARIENELWRPEKAQISAKDALVRIFAWADDTTRSQIAGYLIDWYGVASYEDRARAGATSGAVAMRLVGPPAARKLISVLNGVIAAPGQAVRKNRIGDNLLLGLAVTGHPDAVKYVLDVARMERGDPTLTGRAMAALFKAYVAPEGFDAADREALVPNLPAIVAIAGDDSVAAQPANDAVDLIQAVGAPRCLAPLVGMIAAPHRDPQFKFIVADHALVCGGPGAIARVVRALPDAGVYPREQVERRLAAPIARMTPRDQALSAARALLAEKSTIAKWVGIEVLAAMKATDDAPAIAALSSSRERLAGYWGERAEGRSDPTLGQRAGELAAQLGASGRR